MKKIIPFIAILLASVTLTVQASDWTNWSNFTKVTGMVQQGSTLWIAGHGGVMTIDTLTRQKHYYIKTQGQLPSLMVEDIGVDTISNTIWIGTYDNGMVQVQNGQWTVYPYPSGITLYHFAIDAHGIMWCATSAGLYKFANQAFTFISAVMIGTWDIKLFPSGKLLLASNQPGIYDPVLDTLILPPTPVFTYTFGAIVIESDSSYYFGGQGAGIAHFVDTTATVISDSAIISNFSDPVVQLSIINHQLTALTQNHFLYKYNGTDWMTDVYNADVVATAADMLYVTDHSRLWLGAPQNGGLVRPLSPRGADISLKKFALKSNIVAGVHRKSANELWVMAGNEMGIYNTASNIFTEVDTLPIQQYNNAGDMTIWNGHTVVITNADGLYEWSGTAWDSLPIPGVPIYNVMSIAADTSGNLYVGTISGLFVWNGQTLATYNTSNTTAFANNNDLIRKLYFDASRNTIWAATSLGIVSYNSGVFTLINDVNQPQLSYYTYISSMAQDTGGNMWFGAAYGGLIKFDGANYILDSVPQSIGNQFVSAIAFDGATMYAADDVYGFWIRENGVWTNYNAENSDMTSDYLTGLYVDPNHNVWITSQDYGTKNAFGIDIYNKKGVLLSINEVSNISSVLSYPNPVTDVLYIQSESLHDGDELNVSDLTGRNCGRYILHDNSINMASLSPGVYMISRTGMQTVKVVKE